MTLKLQGLFLGKFDKTYLQAPLKVGWHQSPTTIDMYLSIFV